MAFLNAKVSSTISKKASNYIKIQLAATLIHWYSREKRILPWRESRNPYSVWLSEIILQQTRVAQGTPYFNNFIKKFPTIRDLANASEQEVLKLWEGLGYYSRARNLLAAARQVSDEYGGNFPSTYKELLKLKGIGPYTAAAIASICFDERVPVIDGNVFRLIARIFGITADISQAPSRKEFEVAAQKILPIEAPGDFNQAMMEFGALVCKPFNPDCQRCELSSFCYAFKENAQHLLPVKRKKIKAQERVLNYHVFTHKELVCMNKRAKGDIWQGLWDFFLDERSDSNYFAHEYKGEVKAVYGPISHKLTHQNLNVWFHQIEIANLTKFQELANKLELTIFSIHELVTLPKSKLIVNYLTRVKF